MATNDRVQELANRRAQRMAARSQQPQNPVLSAAKKPEAKPAPKPAQKAPAGKGTGKTEAKATQKPAQKPAQKSKVKAADAASGMGIGHDVMTPVGDMAKGRNPAEYGYAIPKELEKVVKEAEEQEREGATYSLGEVIPPSLVDKVIAVADPVELNAADTSFEMTYFGPGGGTADEILSAGAHWMLTANGRPVAEINLADQDNAGRIAAHFVSDDYAQMIVKGIRTHGLASTLAASHARAYVAVVDRDAKLSDERQALKASFDESLRAARSDVKTHLLNNLGMVIEASVSNFIVQNPLKDELITAMADELGVDAQAASALVDAAFLKQGHRTFSAMFDQAEEWANTPPEALTAIRAAMQKAGNRARPLSAVQNPNFDAGLARDMAQAAVPVMHTSSESTLSASLAGRRQPVQAAAEGEGDELDPRQFRGSFRRR